MNNRLHKALRKIVARSDIPNKSDKIEINLANWDAVEILSFSEYLEKYPILHGTSWDTVENFFEDIREYGNSKKGR